MKHDILTAVNHMKTVTDLKILFSDLSWRLKHAGNCIYLIL